MACALWLDHAQILLHDVARCLALVHQGRLSLNARGYLRKASLRALVKQMSGEGVDLPLNESQAPRASFLAGLLLHAQFLEVCDTTLCVSEAALQWLELPPALALVALREAWFRAPGSGWRWSFPDRRYRSLDAHWRSLTLDTLRVIAGLPVDEWTSMQELLGGLAARGLLIPSGTAYNLPSVRCATESRARQIVGFLVRAVLFSLGLCEVTVDQGMSALRPTPEGAAWLRAALAQQQPLGGSAHASQAIDLSLPSPDLCVPLPETSPLCVEPDLHLAVQASARPILTFEVAHLARLLVPGPPARYRITLRTLQQAVAWGYDSRNVILFLTAWQGEPLPAQAVAQLEEWRDTLSLITGQPGFRLHTAAPAVRDALHRCEPFRARADLLADRQDAWVGEAEAAALFRYLRRLGYTLSLSAHTPDDPLTWEVRALVHSLPLPALLALLQSYRRFCEQVPGLAGLELGGLEPSIARALAPGDLTAVQRIVESNAALLDKAIRPPHEDTGSDPVLGVDAEAELSPADSSQGHNGDTTPGGSGAVGGMEERVPGSSVARDEAAIHAMVTAAVQMGCRLRLTYVDAQAHASQRTVRPLHVESYGDSEREGTRWVLVAFCELRQGERHFRMDRIIEAEMEKGEQDDLPPF